MTREQNEFMTGVAEQYGRDLYQLAYRYTGDPEQARDLFQQTMLTACRRVKKVETHENVKAWLYKVMKFIISREMKKAYRREELFDPDTAEGSPGVDLPMDLYLPRGLKDAEREILLLRVEKELSYEEIAERKGLTESACRQQLSRARRKCRDLMQREKAGEKEPV